MPAESLGTKAPPANTSVYVISCRKSRSVLTRSGTPSGGARCEEPPQWCAPRPRGTARSRASRPSDFAPRPPIAAGEVPQFPLKSANGRPPGNATVAAPSCAQTPAPVRALLQSAPRKGSAGWGVTAASASETLQLHSMRHNVITWRHSALAGNFRALNGFRTQQERH